MSGLCTDGDEFCNVISNWFSLLFFVFAVITYYDYVFSGNGPVAHKNGQLIGTQVSLWAPYIVTYTILTLNTRYRANCLT
jgi:hypothetical protein